MSDKKPLVIGTDGRPQQLQGSDDLDVPLADRVERLERILLALAPQIAELGIALPPELMEMIA